ncbi:MAG: alpha/beta fold hydrolase, partial [Candidatus Binatia bacterium]
MDTGSDSATAHVLTVDGRRLHCRLWTGSGGGAPVLLVHGGGAHAHWWDALVPALGGAHTLIAPDLRGHGQSDWAERYQIEDFGADLLAVLDALAPEPAALVGHSMGGRITTWLAAHHPQRVRAMALLDARLGQIKA